MNSAITPYREPSKRKETGKTFACVAQADNSGQMAVVRWLLQDLQYRVIGILHDKDAGTNPHVHLIIKTPQKLTADTMVKRFGGYVHFEIVHDPYEAARYLTHDTFMAQDKHRYTRSEVFGDMEYYAELLKDASEVLNNAELWASLLAECTGNIQDAFALACARNCTALVKSIMSHGYFYQQYFRVSRSVERVIYDSDGEVISSEVTTQI